MLTLIFAIIFGIVFAFFAIQNTNPVTITLANTPVPNIPLWAIIIGSILLGLLFASVFNVVNIISSKFELHDKDKSIKGADRAITDLRKENQNLKVENAELKAKRVSSNDL